MQMIFPEASPMILYAAAVISDSVRVAWHTHTHTNVRHHPEVKQDAGMQWAVRGCRGEGGLLLKPQRGRTIMLCQTAESCNLFEKWELYTRHKS